jgi:sugar transferase (PEP-CTERM/EpsH1 system associated)
MESLLYLAHRLPYPPNKGDKIRSFNVLRRLAQRYRVFLGCFVDAADDMAQVPRLARWCADVCAVPLDPRLARARALAGFVSGEALTLPYYRSARLQAWVQRVIAREAIAKAVAFSSPMAQYVEQLPGVRTLVDLVDVDSAKWTAYADEHRWPLSAVYRREGRRLLAFERRAVARSAAAVLVTRAEVQLFEQLAPECAGRVYAIENGVDTEYFAPRAELPSPYAAGEVPVVFTGAMDYWPNVDAVTWFAREVLPRLAERRPQLRFYVVGMNPAPAVRALACDARVVVTGTVDDVRPYLQHAAAVVAPLRIARGVQNKVLEAMAMARPVVVSAAAADGIAAEPGVDFACAADAAGFVERTLAVLDAATGRAMGERARTRIRAGYAWEHSVDRFAELLGTLAGDQRAVGALPAAGAVVAG